MAASALEAAFASLLSRPSLVAASTPHAARALAAAVAASRAGAGAGAGAGAEPPSAYAGFDATAASLHLGHLPVLLMLRRLQRLGLRPVALVGTATALVGDPSGRATGRAPLAEEACARNAAGIRADIEAVLSGDAGEADGEAGGEAGGAAGGAAGGEAGGAAVGGAGAGAGAPAALILDNAAFYEGLSLMAFLRERPS
jgi:tyrosyl-tRNA synthetase